jgi:putative NIF3 family GTP cyclohydrolase 1 type 2
VSGSAADTVTTFAAEGFDTFVTGEPKQFVYHFCKEHNLNAIFAGHYATETVGVRAVGERLASHFGLRHQFLDLPTGI